VDELRWYRAHLFRDLADRSAAPPEESPPPAITPPAPPR
jgi:hypothetical protein